LPSPLGGSLLLYRHCAFTLGAKCVKAIRRKRTPGNLRWATTSTATSLKSWFTLSRDDGGGCPGATKSSVSSLASLTDVHWSMSGEVVLDDVVRGGQNGTIPLGPCCAGIIVTMQNYLATSAHGSRSIQGVIFVNRCFVFAKGIGRCLGAGFKRPPLNQNWRLKCCSLDPLFKFQGDNSRHPDWRRRAVAVDNGQQCSRFSDTFPLKRGARSWKPAALHACFWRDCKAVCCKGITPFGIRKSVRTKGSIRGS